MDDLREETLWEFSMIALYRFIIPQEIFITTDGYHYESVIRTVSKKLQIAIRRQRCSFHIGNDLAYRIRDAKMESELYGEKNLIKYMSFQDDANLKKLGKNMDAILDLTKNENGKEIVHIMMHKIRNLHGGDPLISDLIIFVKRHRNEVLLYLEGPMVEKTSEITVQHFSIQSWLFKHRFKTKEDLLRTSYWYHRYLSTGS